MKEEINAEEAKTCIGSGSIVLDVRTKEEYENGHIPKSINLDIHDASFEEKIGELDKEKSYVVYCASGGRSLNAVKIMSGLSFNDAHSLSGGMMDWKKEGMDVVE